MDQPVTDRRLDARFLQGEERAARATLRPGCPVDLVNVSASGALVQGDRPLRPGARVHLQLATTTRTFAVAAHVLRCAVYEVDPQGVVIYRGALKFEHRCDRFWEGPPVPGPATPDTKAPPGGAHPGKRRHAR